MLRIVSVLATLSFSASAAVIAVVGAGPAAISLTQSLTDQGHEVVVLNKDPLPGGLVKYGFYYTKEHSKSSLLSAYERTLRRRNVDYYGNVAVGASALTLDELERLPFDAIVFAVGAETTRRLHVPGDEHVTAAADIFRYYNGHPDYREKPPRLGKKIVLVGAGNTMLDIARFLLALGRDVDLTVLVRRGPEAMKFQDSHFVHVAPFLDREAHLHVSQFHRKYVVEYPKSAKPKGASGTVRFRFFAPPEKIDVDASGRVVGIHAGGEVIPCDAVIPAIGGENPADLGLPWNKGRYARRSARDLTITHDLDFKAREYYPTRTLDDYAVDAGDLPKFLVGWARLPNVGKGLRWEEHLNAEDDGLRLGALLGKELFLRDGTAAREVVRQFLRGRVPRLVETFVPPKEDGFDPRDGCAAMFAGE